jgi:hypothetical protein
MSARAEALASQYEQVLADLQAEIEQCPDSKWSAVCSPEGWTVAATAHHVGSQLPLEREYLTAAAASSPMPAYTWDDINARNAKHAADFAAASREDAIRIIRDNGLATAVWVRGLSDEQLDRKSPLPLANGAEVTTQQLIEGGVLIEHAISHLQSIRNAG